MYSAVAQVHLHLKCFNLDLQQLSGTQCPKVNIVSHSFGL